MAASTVVAAVEVSAIRILLTLPCPNSMHFIICVCLINPVDRCKYIMNICIYVCIESYFIQLTLGAYECIQQYTSYIHVYRQVYVTMCVFVYMYTIYI